tara:strand:- start:1250 stop:1669 length:420 start_codon:yes stop_codon:yes gene_type:complete
MKQCRICHDKKDIDQFYLCKRKGGNPEARHTECKQCAKDRVKLANATNPDRARNSHLLRNYGITLDTFNGMVSTQNSRCACCGTAEPRGKHDQWCVDHDHVTNKVRELLCKDCNIVLGIVSDSPTHLKQLIQYIAKHND